MLAPTDPVPAGDVQVGPPFEGREHTAHGALATEAGLHDGLAVPFVDPALHVALCGVGLAAVAEWVLWDVLHRVAMGVALGRPSAGSRGVWFVVPAGNALAEARPGVMALAAVLPCDGPVEPAEVYGLVAAVVARAVTRRAAPRSAARAPATSTLQRGAGGRGDPASGAASGRWWPSTACAASARSPTAATPRRTSRSWTGRRSGRC